MELRSSAPAWKAHTQIFDQSIFLQPGWQTQRWQYRLQFSVRIKGIYFYFFFLGRIKTCSIRKVQRVSGKQKNSSGIQIKNKTSEEGGNSQQCIDTASCTGLLLCVWLPVWALHLVCYCLSKTNQREGRLEGKKKGKEKTRGGEILCICEAEGYCLSGFVPCYLFFFCGIKIKNGYEYQS